VGDGGKVTVNAIRKKDRLIISVTDDGCGIPKQRLKQLGERGVTFDKPNGRGLGLHHAQKVAKSWGGDLKIESAVGEGTTVTVSLPNVEPPKWFVPELNIDEKTTVVVLDDDNSIHQTWANKFESLGAEKKGVKLLKFSRADDILQWRKTSDVRNTLYLCDYQLNYQNKSGLDVIEELAIPDQSILVTGHFEEPEVRDRCAALGVRLVPKELIGFLPINLQASLSTAP
jgi:hypothetical protein